MDMYFIKTQNGTRLINITQMRKISIEMTYGGKNYGVYADLVSEECLLGKYYSLDDAQDALGDFIKFINTRSDIHAIDHVFTMPPLDDIE